MFTFCAYAQKGSIDLKKIKKEIFKKDSNYNIDKLTFKYQGLPKSLDSLDSQYLYYARNFQSNVINTNDQDFVDLAENFRSKNYSSVVSRAKNLLAKDPTNLDILMIVIQSCEALEDSKNFTHYLLQFRALTKAIIDSGNGKTEETPYLVNSVGDEYILLNISRWPQESIRSSKAVKGGMLDVWDDNGKKIYIKVIYND